MDGKNPRGIDFSLSLEWAEKHLKDDIPPMICGGVCKPDADSAKEQEAED